jgi:hypothetical protein
MADKGGLQLLPDTRKKLDIKVPGENRLISIGVVFLVVVLVVSGGLWWYSDSLANQVADADAQLAQLEKERDKKAEQSLLTLSKQISITNQIIQRHTHWSTGLTKLEAALQNNIQFKSFSSNIGEESLNVHALADNYATIARQLAALVADDSVEDVSLNGVSSLTNGRLDFTVKINFDSLKFLKK